MVGCRASIPLTECRLTAVFVPAPQLTCDDLLPPALAAGLPGVLSSLFPRRDQAAFFGAYAEGLLSGERCKSIERMVLRQLEGDMNQVRRLQYFAADSPWSDRLFPDGTGRRWRPSWARARASFWWTRPACPSRECIRWAWPGRTVVGRARLKTARRGVRGLRRPRGHAGASAAVPD